ncbi:MAG: IS1595 family transposase [Planctomycetes bacterium]|nr:IS1595 family transposase [Planctomycetota bacterium]
MLDILRMERGKKHPIDPTIEALRVASTDEALAVTFMEARRWGNEPECPYCQSKNVARMCKRGTIERNKDFRLRCRQCKTMFTVRTGTVMEESRLPLRVWCHAFWRACSSKKGVSALQISREAQISYKSALFLMARIRAAMENDPTPMKGQLGGVVEIDETFIGGKPRYHRRQSQGGWKRRSVPVLGMVERGGRLRLRQPEDLGTLPVAKVVHENVDISSRIYTDEARRYRSIGWRFKGGHEHVKHSAGEYARGDVHSNTIESAFAIVKRGIYGVFHSVSPEHLSRYLAEFAFKYNYRDVDDGQRTEAAIRASVGRRLMYKDYVARK